MKVNHKSLKLGVAFALVSTVGITSAEIIKHELFKPIIAVEETTTTTTESPEKIKYKKEVQEFSKTMRPVVAKYGVTDEKLDELVNRWIQGNKYTSEFEEENKKKFIEYVIDSTSYNFIINEVDKTITIIEKSNYYDETKKKEWINELIEYKEDQQGGEEYHLAPYSRTRYYEEDRKNLINNYHDILEKTIQYIKENRIKYRTEKLFSYEIENILGFAEMQEEKEILEDTSLSEQDKKQLLEKIDDILEVKYTSFRNDKLSFEIINNIISEIRQVHLNKNGKEYEEPFSKEKVEKYIERIVKEKEESKVKEIISKAKVQFEEYVSSQKGQLLTEGISQDEINKVFVEGFKVLSNRATYFYRIDREGHISDITKRAIGTFDEKITIVKAEIKVIEALKLYIKSQTQKLENYNISNETIEKIIASIRSRISDYGRALFGFNYDFERLLNKAKEDFNREIKPYEIKYLSKERLKEYALEKQQELLKYGISKDKNRDIIEKVFDKLRERRLDYNINREDNDAYLESLTNRAKNQYQEMILEEVVKGKILEFEKQQIELVSSDTRYTESELEFEISVIKNSFKNRVGNLDLHFIQGYFEELFKTPNLSLQELIDKVVSYTQNQFSKVYYSAPVSKNKFTINNVALNEKLEINQDNSLSISEKLALQLKVDLLAEKAINKINQLNLRAPNKDTKPRAMTAEELAVFIEQIQNIHNAKVVNNANEVFKPKEEKIEKPLLEKPAPTESVDNGGTITEKPSVLPELKPVQPTETTSTIELKPVVSTEKEEKTTEVVSNKVETTKENEETTKEVVSRNKWEKKGNHWYYVDNDGKAVSKQWVGSYYIKADKTMAENEWIYDAKYNSWFYLDENGHYVENTWKDQYYLKSGGYMAKNEWIFDSSYNSWYYLNEDGSYARNQWIQSNGKWYYVLSNGKMAKNTVIDGYQLNENGEWV